MSPTLPRSTRRANGVSKGRLIDGGVDVRHPVGESGVENTRFEASYRRVFGPGVHIGPDGDAFFARFYEHFVARSPRISQLFRSTDMSRQVGMLRQSIYEVLTFYLTGQVNTRLRKIAQIHQRLAVTPELWEEWLDSLIETVREFDPACDELTEYAWRLALTPGLTYLKVWSGSDKDPDDGP